METILVIIVITAIVLHLFRPVPQSQIVYVPIEIAEPQRGLGCLSMFVMGILLALVVLALFGSHS